MSGLEFLAPLFAGGAAAGGAAASTGATLATIGKLAGAAGTIFSGIAANSAANYEAAQMEQKATEERAAATREAAQKRREGQLIQSRQQALAAASGAGAGTDAPTIIKLMTDTASFGDYSARSHLYGGESRARGLTDAARGRRASGQASLLGSFIGGFGQAAKAFG
jgi:hypothetical protein